MFIPMGLVVLHIPFLPTSIPLSKKKNWFISLNKYRNTHFRSLSLIKKMYTAEVHKQLRRQGVYKKDEWLFPGRFIFVYTLYPRNEGRIDVANICSVVDKFTADALVKAKVIPDDDSRITPIVVYKLGEVDPENPRCELTIHQMKEEK